MEIIGTVEQLRRTIAGWRAQAMRTALVPTMGALHDGHIALVHQALRLADRIVVSIFVNPKQFGAHEDLGKYPRDEAGDRRKLKEAGAHLIYAPATLEMYPEGFATEVALSGPATVGLEDRFRPHFFAGVATAVAKLFIQAGCDYAMFGEKDYQQLKVVTRMAGDLDIPTVVIPVATVRESDGLAMSSRNAYLSRAADPPRADRRRRCHRQGRRPCRCCGGSGAGADRGGVPGRLCGGPQCRHAGRAPCR